MGGRILKELVVECEKISNKYPKLLLDFVILEIDGNYLGEITHRKAIKTVFEIFNKREQVANRIIRQYTFDEKELVSYKYTSEEFFSKERKRFKQESDTVTSILDLKMNYWDAFSYPPYPTPYDENDFDKLNHMLFPQQHREDFEIYSWNDEFSNYFDDGKEWWGTGMWSIYDKHLNRITVVGASLSD